MTVLCSRFINLQLWFPVSLRLHRLHPSALSTVFVDSSGAVRQASLAHDRLRLLSVLLRSTSVYDPLRRQCSPLRPAQPSALLHSVVLQFLLRLLSRLSHVSHAHQQGVRLRARPFRPTRLFTLWARPGTLRFLVRLLHQLLSHGEEPTASRSQRVHRHRPAASHGDATVSIDTARRQQRSSRRAGETSSSTTLSLGVGLHVDQKRAIEMQPEASTALNETIVIENIGTAL